MTLLCIDELRKLPLRPLEHLNFQSNSEYACARLLEKYAGWRGLEGTTCQIAVGRAMFDFRIEDVFVEYHPISLRREFLTDSLRTIMSITHKLKREDKLQVLEAISEELKAQYSKRRGQTLAAHPAYSRMELICVHSQEEFVDLVLRRFSTHKLPSTQQLCQEFRALIKLSKKLKDH
jgi:hypothetical protein